VINNPKRSYACIAVGQAKIRSRNKGLPFDLTTDFVESICPDICPVLGVELDYSKGTGAGGRWNSPSLDRMIPELGYLQTNVHVIALRANVIKSDGSVDELRAILAWMEKSEERIDGR